jgi:S-adenosylmethionine-diacylglycerol 3-amino-3-carboxypropyl transferase
MTDIAPNAGFHRNHKLKDALLQHTPLSPAGISERLFGLLFSGLVYAQIWEDPEVDMDAMELTEGARIITIGSGGCNMLAYLSRRPASIDVVDLNPNHVALNRLKLAAFRHLPDHASVRRLLGEHAVRSNGRSYERFIAPHLDGATRAYWEARDLLGRRRISVFNRNIYRTGLLGRFITLGHLIARSHGVRLGDLAETRSLREQRMFFDSRIAPLFDKPLIRWLTRRKSSLFGLGIPPQQYDELASLADDGTIAPVLRHRLEKLCCHFLLRDNYFAWQAFMRRYPKPDEGVLPTYLQERHYGAIRDTVDRVCVHHASFTELLKTKPAASIDRYVLLDAQDWMTPRQLNELWTEIARTAADSARVIFRTAAEDSILDGKLAPEILGQWTYEAERSQILTKQDRSAIYGGFHIYEKRSA